MREPVKLAGAAPESEVQSTALSSSMQHPQQQQQQEKGDSHPAEGSRVAGTPKSTHRTAASPARKNISSLFLIKSYSFIEKAAAKSQAIAITKNRRTGNHSKVKKVRSSELLSPDVENFATFQSLLLEQEENNRNLRKSKKFRWKSSLKKLQKTPTIEDFDELKAILRQPTMTQTDGGAKLPPRPASLPNHTAAYELAMAVASSDGIAAIVPPTASGPAEQSAAIKRESFLRQSLHTLRRSFGSHRRTGSGGGGGGIASSASSTTSSSSIAGAPKDAIYFECSARLAEGVDTRGGVPNGSGNGGDSAVSDGVKDALTSLREEEDEARQNERSASSVTALHSYTGTADASVAPLQGHAEAQSVSCLSTYDRDSNHTTSTSSVPRQQLSSTGINRSGNSSTSSSVCDSQSAGTTRSGKADLKALRHSSNSLNPLGAGSSTASVRSISPARKSANGASTTTKHEQSTGAATSAAVPPPPEKEKKRKEVSSSRVKKFHRHFTQVSKDEKLINYYSCALVSDILLQGHLYITEKHFAFYSNVFGYVTKVVIPTSSVTKISKEKTAKIIPNAVGVATADERHVFGSFISREAAFRLMCSVCQPLVPPEMILPKAPAEIEISEEYSIEDDSSCSISGNESPPQLRETASDVTDSGQKLTRRSAGGGGTLSTVAEDKAFTNTKYRHSDIPPNAKTLNTASNQTQRVSAPPDAALNAHLDAAPTPTDVSEASTSTATTTVLPAIIAGSASSTTSPSSTPTQGSGDAERKPKTASQAAAKSLKAYAGDLLRRVKFPTELHVVYVGVFLTAVLALLSVFLLYKIVDIEARTSVDRSPLSFNWRTSSNDELFAEALRWQRELQQKSTDEAQSILTTNLEQIAKVRRSLETLSMLIDDRSSQLTAAATTTITDEND